VQFGEPDHVEPEALGGVDLGKGLGKYLCIGLSRISGKLVKDAELERHDCPRTHNSCDTAALAPACK
jgi:hypothetical protein